MLTHRRPLDHPLVVQSRVIRALMLRDIRTRFFGHGLGYLISIAWPLAHLTLLIVIYYFTGRVAPYGDSLLLFFATALVPTISFMYISRFIMLAALVNKPLVHFPVVKIVDLFLARGVLEVFASCIMTLVVMGTLYCLGIDVVPPKPLEAGYALLASFLLAFGLGFLMGLIAMALPGIVIAYTLVTIVLYITSGVLFVADELPAAARYALSWNPIFHGVEWMRTAYYLGYRAEALDKAYLISFGIGSLFIGLITERLVRGKMLGG
ncbi:ABC transporter permease [uncultured Enterovirga sp.]|uniref:ABC transporter permease n=1 Tax=uncultured Enterovirga sp. TaxID=2026352 RepID=UPI0035CBF94A